MGRRKETDDDKRFWENQATSTEFRPERGWLAVSFGSKSLPTPTAADLERWAAIKERMQCVACFAIGPVECHHLLSGGGLRIGHRYTASLCRFCHSVVKTRGFKASFTNQALLDATDFMIGWPLTMIPARRERRKPSNTARPSKSFRPAAEAKPLRDERGTLEVSKTTQRKRKGSARGTHCQRPEKVIPRRHLV